MPTVTVNEVVVTREPYFVTADLMHDQINCGDDRPSDFEKYIHMFGGALFVAYTSAIMRETAQPDSVQNLPELTEQVIAHLRASGTEGLGVHSDSAAEEGNTFQTERSAGPVGCGYAAKRAAISQLIFENGESIVSEASTLFPELFVDESAWTYGHAVAQTHGRLAERSASVIGDGRHLVLAAQGAGANTMVVDGVHTADEGIINTRRNTTLDTNSAVANGSAAYNHDLWASNDLLEMLPENLDRQQAAIASVIDIVGTMKALGVERIGVR